MLSGFPCPKRVRIVVTLALLGAAGACSDESAADNGTAQAGTAASSSGSGGVGATESAGSNATGSGGSSGAASGAAGSTAAGMGGRFAAGTGGAESAGQSGQAGTAGQGGAAGETAVAGTGGSAAPTPSDGDLIAAPDGRDDAAGTLAAPTTLTAAITRIAAGKALFLRGGTYAYDAQITIAADNSGAMDRPKTITAYEDEKPILDFSEQPYGASGNARGLQIEGSYWHVIGLTVRGSADNGIYIAGSHNVIERCVTHGNRDTGLQIGRASSSTPDSQWPSHNLVLNCESYDNYDGPPGSGENADGFAAKLTSGPGNVFRGCIAHHNIDDGWDLYTKSDTGPIGAVTIDQCVAHHNGTLTDGTSNGNGDRNGFKLGGERIAVGHTVTRSVSFANGKDGFTWNSNPGAIRISNTLSFDNAQANYRFGDNSTPTQAVFTNNVSFRSAAGGDGDKHVGSDVANSNVWSPNQNAQAPSVSAADFAGSLADPTLARNPDGSIDFSPFRPATGSDLINAGAVPAGELPFDPTYYRGMPDLGAVETP